MNKQKRRRFKIAITIIVIGLIIVIGWRFRLQFNDLVHAMSNRQLLIDTFQHHGPIDLITYTALLVVCIWLPGAPVAVLAIAAGVCFGHWTAFLLNVIGMTIGNFVAANVIPDFFKTPTHGFSSKLYADLLKIRHPRLGIILGYTIPFIPSTVINLAAKRLITRREQLLGLCMLGSVTPAFLYAFGGDAALRGNLKALLPVVIVGALLFGLIWVIHIDRKRIRAKTE